MKIIAYTQYGVVEGISTNFSQEKFEEVQEFFKEKIHEYPLYLFATHDGKFIIFTKEEIANTRFVVDIQ